MARRIHKDKINPVKQNHETKNPSFAESLEALQTARVTKRHLRGLSDLEHDALTQAQQALENLPTDKRATVLRKLRDLNNEDLEYNFEPLFILNMADADEHVRTASVEGLAETENIKLIDPLIFILRNDASDDVRAAAASALGQFVYLGELDDLPRAQYDRVYAALMQTLLTAPRNSMLYARALEAIGYASNDEVRRLVRAAHNEGNEDLRVSALVAMSRSGDESYRDLPLKDLHSESAQVRMVAARACAELGMTEAVTDIGKLLKDKERDVQFAAIDALADIATDDARAILKHTTRLKDHELAEAAEEALEEAEMMGDIYKMLDADIQD